MPKVAIFKIDQWGYPRFTNSGFAEASELTELADNMRAEGHNVVLLTYGEFKAKQDPDSMSETEVDRRFGNNLKRDQVKRGVVITGSISGLTRQQLESKLQEMGWTPQRDVSSATAYVVAGGNPGSKIQRAEKAGIPVVSWGQMQGLCV